MNKQVHQLLDEEVYTSRLDNGLKVFLIPKREMSKVYGLFTTDYGSIDQTFIPHGENKQITVPEGIAHFLEHKLFEKEDRDVFADFGKQGASPNAYTSFTKTAYLFSATDQIEKNVLTLLDFVQDPYFSDQSVEKEKGIIAQEIKMYDDRPDWRAFMGNISGMFEHHPVNIDIAGTVDSIYKITKEDLYVCYETFYHPSNMTFILTGNFNPNEIMSLIAENQNNKSFAPVKEIERFYPEEKAEVAMKEKVIHMPVSIPKSTVGIKEVTGSLMGDDFLIKDLFQSMFLNHFYSNSGEFYRELYDKNMIDDSFSFSSTLEKNFGYSIISSNSNNPDQFSELVKEQLLKTKSMKFTEEEFEKMKKKKIGQMLRQLNSVESIANQYVHYYSFDVDYFTIIPALQSLSLDTANDYLHQWIDEERLTVCKIIAS